MCPLDRIRRLRRKNGKITAYNVGEGSLTQDELNKLDYHIRTTRGSLLFSRCWLLVEGETEAPLISECGRALGRDLYADGVSCIEFAQVGVEKFIKLADQLGIEWFVLADNDPAGEKYVKSAESQLGDRKADKHIRMLDHGPMEVFLCVEGFGHIYKSTISAKKKGRVTADEGTLEYWCQVVQAQQKRGSKTRNAMTVANEMVEAGPKCVPLLLRDVIKQVTNLAGSAI